MFVRDRGLIGERTEKVDANHDLVRVFEILDQGNPVQTILTGLVLLAGLGLTLNAQDADPVSNAVPLPSETRDSGMN
jgi:hypothetical protein